MKKIVLFEDVFGDFGGIEKVIITIVSNFFGKYEFELVVNSIISKEYIDDLKKYNVHVVQLQKDYIRNPIKRHLEGFKKFKQYLKDNRWIDTIHFNISNSIDLNYVCIAKKFKIKNRIAHSHNSSATSKFKILMHKLIKPFTMNSPTVFLACSDLAAKWLFSKKVYRNKKYIFLPNVVDYEQFKFNEEYRKEIRSKYHIQDDEILFGHVGRFNTQKNHNFLVNVFAKINNLNPNTKLILIGKGELKEEIINKCKDLKVDSSVIFVEPTKEVYKYYSAFDTLLFPSFFEGLGIVLVESQCASLKCITSDSISDQSIFTPLIIKISLNDENKWVQEALKTEDNSKIDVSNYYLTSSFSIDKMVSILEEIYSR